MVLVDLIILFAAVLGCAYFEVPKILWTLVIGLVLLMLTFFGHLGFFSLSFFWLIFIFAVVFVNATQLRQRYFTRPLMLKMQKNMPAISKTEREAIQAGNVWWEKDLFNGRPDWKQFLANPKPQLTQEEQDFLDNQVETLCGMLDDWKIVFTDHDLPEAVWNYLKAERFFGLVIPKEYGGHGFSALAHSTIVVKIATRSISTAVNTMVPNSLGPAELLLHYGSDEQKAYYLPRLVTGEEIPCFALTSPDAGSDAGSITDSGIITRGEFNGKEIIGIRLNWDKRYITLAPIATVLGLAFQLYDPEHLLGDTEDLGITLCLVPTSHPGVKIGDRHLPLHTAIMNGPTRGKDVFIPLDWIIGGKSNAGKGWKMLMESLSIGRSISLPALSSACGQLIYRMTGAYARIRRQFNLPIANFEGVEEALANIAGMTYMLEACRKLTLGAVDQKITPAIASAMTKYNMTEMARKVIEHAMDIHGGHGIQVGPHNFLAPAHIAIPISITVEGANILTRNLIIFGQGVIRCHPFIGEEIKIFAEPDEEKKLPALDKILIAHIGYLISNFARSFVRGLTGGKLIVSPVSGPTARYYRQLNRMSSALAFLSDVSMILLGGSLKRKERISARLGDILSQLYLASAVLKFYNDYGQQSGDLIYVQWCVETCLYQMQVACDEVLDNFPQPILGKILHWIIFPWGRAYRQPKDILSHKIVGPMTTPSELRQRLTANCYIGKTNDDITKQLDDALSNIETIEPIWKKFHAATRDLHGDFSERLQAAIKLGAISTPESQTLTDYDKLRREIIKVNEFSFDLSTVLS